MKKILLIIIGFGLISCAKQAPYSPTPSPNPWEDNYRSISQMENYRQWGTYNVHDPACKKFGDYYYMYSTDAIFAENKKEAKEKGVPLGYIQVRRSKDLVNWEFQGWAFNEIPQEAVEWVRNNADGKGATNIWAPYIIQHNDTYRLYYCVSAFGQKTSYIGLAESTSPEGPWELKGCVVKTNKESVMNAIDPSIIVDENGKWWMHYGSYFGGLFCVELNPETGLAKTQDDQGHLVARRANYRKDNLEAPEIVYNPELKEYFLFVSYDPLMTTYNVRVGRGKQAEGPFFDFNEQNLKDTTNNFPILTAPYQFDNHPGWAGTAHCGVLEDNGRYFMFHQARLSPQNMLMVLHTREVFFNSQGWPVASPERYAATPQRKFDSRDMAGEWEVIRLIEPLHERQLEAGQILWGEGELVDEEWNRSFHIVLTEKGEITDRGTWKFLNDKQIMQITLDDEPIDELIVFAGQDWENEMQTILFTGLDKNGRSVWGKRIK
ncbi:arabinan endo-1,5-alpha-L-arabinosidase [Bacteroides sp. 519]|uniref:arabinan endo-1,5-alpha-L-arabinosidase n=1 Tax=Bacteroides sp. 519 TaxID=2302937 RepID=UPI0013D12E98|nr:arabinan endo-1,5-alpha-L-arabinosidase [Bacteroides sp. 519]NDV58313.1 arabinan endo-1,5-alpha-L-arabinosidase [Bacteroides sp. 519]